MKTELNCGYKGTGIGGQDRCSLRALEGAEDKAGVT